jgi:hypothetical protein
VFVHLVDSEGVIQAQADGQPLGDDYPTSYWALGPMIEDPIHMRLHDDLPPGDYRLVVGMYDVETDTRLSVSSGRLPNAGRDWVELAQVRIR